MWIDDQGVCHTVALPDPTELMSEVFRESLDRLLAEHQVAVAEMIEAEEERFFEEQAVLSGSAADEAEFEGQTPPLMLLSDPIGTVGDLRSVIREIDRRWRLDALTALDDYVA